MNFDWNQARAFLAAAEQGSLSAAARTLNITQPTVSRQVAGLEEDLGIPLFERVGRGLVLTPSGRKIASHLSAMRKAADMVLLSAEGQSQTLEGNVSISISDIFAHHIFIDALPGLQALAPGLQIEIVAANEISDLQRRDADIAVRHVRPTEPELVGKLAGQVTASLYAAKNYLDSYGRPKTISDYASADFIAIGPPEEMQAHLGNLGLDVALERFRYRSQNGIVAWNMARKGLGLLMMADAVAQTSPSVEQICGEQISIEFPLWLTAHKEVRSSARIRAVWDYLDEWIRASALVS